MRKAATRAQHQRARLATAVALVAALWPALAGAQPVRVTIERVTIGELVVEDLAIETDLAGTMLTIEAGGTAPFAGWRAADLRLDCTRAGWGADEPCAGAGWSLALAPATPSAPESGWPLPVSGTMRAVELPGDDWRVESSLRAGPFEGNFAAGTKAATLTGSIAWRNQPLTGLGELPLPSSPLDWLLEGAFSGSVDFALDDAGPVRLDYRLGTDGLSFDSPEGVYAASALDVELEGSAALGDALSLQARMRILGGELLVDRFYAAFDATPLRIEADAVKRGSELRLESLRVGDGKAVEVVATADTDLDAPVDSLDWRVDRLELKFPLAYERYLEPMLGPLTLDGLAVTGTVLWQGSGRPDAYPEGNLEVRDLSIVDRERERFAITGLEANVHAGESPAASHVAWRGLLFQKINLGPGEARIETRPGAFELAEPLRLEVLGGQLVFPHVSVLLPPADAPEDAEPELTVEASLQDMEMALLTEALGWPRFEGRISGRIPGVSLEGGVLDLDGEIGFEVFDGRLRLYGLRIERLFGVLPSLAANIEVENFDLERLTRTFSFGRISGRMDGYVRDLRMLDWEPVAFDAWFGTPVGQKTDQDISRRAVNHLTTIGGGGPTTALTGPLLGLFNNFSYRRLGIGCALENYVCRLRGLEDDQEGVLILEGAGIPKITIRAYNRRMDFPQLVANLKAAAGAEGVRIGDGP